MTTQTLTSASAAPAFSFVTMVEGLVAGEHLEKNPWTADAMWHSIANQAIDALVAAGDLDRTDADIITGVTPLDDLPGLTGCPTPSPVWRAIYTTHRLASGTAFAETKFQVRNITARRAVTNKQFSFMVGVLVDRDVRRAKARRQEGGHRPATLQTARNAFSDGGFLTDAVAGKNWTPVYKSPDELLDLALNGGSDARDAQLTLMIGGGFVLIMDGYLTRDRESKFFEGTTPYRGTPPAILTDLAAHEHGLRQLATAWARWQPDAPAHEYDIPEISGDGSLVITGETLETRRPKRLDEDRLFRIASPSKVDAGLLKARQSRNRPESPEDRDRQNREILGSALQLALQAVNELKVSKVSPPPEPFGDHDEWQRFRDTTNEVYATLLKHEPDIHADFPTSESPDDEDQQGTLL